MISTPTRARYKTYYATNNKKNGIIWYAIFGSMLFTIGIALIIIGFCSQNNSNNNHKIPPNNENMIELQSINNVISNDNPINEQCDPKNMNK